MRISIGRIGRIARVAVAVGLCGVVLAGCGEDDPSVTGGDDGGGDGGENSVKVEMKDYSYAVSGELTAGMATIESSNTGEEFHMMIVSKLKPGVTLDEVTEGLTAMFSEEGGEGGEPGTEAEEEQSLSGSSPALQLIAQTSSSSSTSTTEGEVTTQGQDEGEGQQGEEEGGDPLAEFFEAPEGDGPEQALNHVLQPGEEIAITADVLTEGTYAMLCFIPTVEEGTLHLAEGMIGSIEVKDGKSDAKAPKADATYTIADGEPPAGPEELQSGRRTIELKADGGDDNQFATALPEDGEDFDSFDEFFTELFEAEEAPPADYVDNLPGRLGGFFEAIPANETIWITHEFEVGDWLFANVIEDEDTGESENFVLTVKVT